jgi:hypothetical protein
MAWLNFELRGMQAGIQMRVKFCHKKTGFTHPRKSP